MSIIISFTLGLGFMTLLHALAMLFTEKVPNNLYLVSTLVIMWVVLLIVLIQKVRHGNSEQHR